MLFTSIINQKKFITYLPTQSKKFELLYSKPTQF